MPYMILKDEATADVAFVVQEKNLKDIFQTSAKAVFNTLVETKSVGKTIVKELYLEETDPEKLLLKFLEEIVYIKDADNMVFSSVEISLAQGHAMILRAQLLGENIDPKKHKLKLDVKAVTLHMFRLQKKKNGWEAKFVLDI
ncbi:MAG: hypothetical protein QS98_C0011G0073 [archaeon GW2011_AR3]|nr:MAG: hypothetical protein QS98_C0011G0073 [archaeon GW2011_AR3]MBS3109662.1 archease [Candidatus Woesearchaeota archaeon]